eukprot:Gb_25159 [translate_table: standard]
MGCKAIMSRRGPPEPLDFFVWTAQVFDSESGYVNQQCHFLKVLIKMPLVSLLKANLSDPGCVLIETGESLLGWMFLEAFLRWLKQGWVLTLVVYDVHCQSFVLDIVVLARGRHGAADSGLNLFCFNYLASISPNKHLGVTVVGITPCYFEVGTGLVPSATKPRVHDGKFASSSFLFPIETVNFIIRPHYIYCNKKILVLSKLSAGEESQRLLMMPLVLSDNIQAVVVRFLCLHNLPEHPGMDLLSKSRYSCTKCCSIYKSPWFHNYEPDISIIFSIKDLTYLWDVGIWLERIGLGSYRQIFGENGINGEYLDSLSTFTTEQILRFIRRSHMKWGDFIILCKELHHIKVACLKGEQEVRSPWWAPPCLFAVFIKVAKHNRQSRVVSLKLDP